MKVVKKEFNWGNILLEILTIVLGITIAFWVDNWSKHRENKELEKAWLYSLQKDMQFNLKAINEIIFMDSVGNISSEKMKELLLSEPERDTLSLDKETYFKWQWMQEFNPTNATYEFIKYSGNIQIMSNQKILFDLINIQSDYVRLMNASKYQHDEIMIKKIDPLMFDNFDAEKMYSESKTYQIEYAKLKKIPNLYRFISENQIAVKSKLGSFKIGREKTVALIKLIDDEL